MLGLCFYTYGKRFLKRGVLNIHNIKIYVNITTNKPESALRFQPCCEDCFCFLRLKCLFRLTLLCCIIHAKDPADKVSWLWIYWRDGQTAILEGLYYMNTTQLNCWHRYRLLYCFRWEWAPPKYCNNIWTCTTNFNPSYLAADQSSSSIVK